MGRALAGQQRWVRRLGFQKGGLFLLLLAGALGLPNPGGSQTTATLSCKSWPPGYFLKQEYRQAARREQVFRDIARELQGLNQRGQCLAVKGTVIEPLETIQKYYDKITILDESGLKVVVRRVPNLYYRYPGPPARLNPNVFLVAKNLRFNEVDSRLKESLIVEGDFVAYAGKYLEALQKYWGNGNNSAKE